MFTAINNLFSFCITYYLIIILFGVEAKQNQVVLSLESNSASKVVNLHANSSILIQATNIHQDVTSVVFEAHTQRDNLTLSLTSEPAFHTSVTGKNIGLTSVIEDAGSGTEIWLFNSNEKNISALLILVPYVADDPVPGGCNMEFPIDIAPYLKLFNDRLSTRLEYQHANIGSSKNTPPPSCSKSISYLSYEIFVFFLKENYYSEDEYFRGIESMSNTSFINRYATKVKTYALHPGTRSTFFKYPNVGAVYNVIAKYTINGNVKAAAYVPSATYGCRYLSTEWGCISHSALAIRIFLWILSAYGLIISFCGHRYFDAGMFFFGFLVFTFVGFILIAKYGHWNKTSTLAFSVTIGVVGGIIWLILWTILFQPMLALLPVGFALGILITATLLYSPLGNSEIFTDDKNYWVMLFGGTLLIAAVFLLVPKMLSIIGSSIVGSYATVIILDEYLGTSLIFIVLNVIKRAMSNSLAAASNDYPFQTSDIIVSSLWLGLSLLTVTAQIYTHWRNPHFREPYFSHWKCFSPICTCNPANLRTRLSTSDCGYQSEQQGLTQNIHSHNRSYNTISTDLPHA